MGSIYLSTKSTNPSILFGGTWVSWGSGRVPVGVNTGDSNFNTVEKTGGSKSHKHLLPYASDTKSGNWSYLQWNHDFGYGSVAITSQNRLKLNGNPESVAIQLYQPYTQEVSTLQPYITCYMWKRTA